MKILYVTTISNTMRFVIPHVQFLINSRNVVDVVCNITNSLDEIISEMGCRVYNIPFQRNPVKKENIVAYKKLKKLIIDEQYDVVHTHTPVASAIVRLVCKNIKGIKVMYTAHGFHFYKGAPLRNWLLYYPVEKYLSKYTDILITINKEDYNRAKNNFFAKKVEYMPGVGLDIEKFKNIKVDKKEKRRELGVPEDCFLALSVGELNKNKNHEIIIKAISKIENNNINYIVCGSGPLKDYLIYLSEKLGIKDRVHLLGCRQDIGEICKCSDLFIFPSKREGLGLAALEAMACGLPIITSNIHGIKDYSKDNYTGYTCKSDDENDFGRKILILKKDELLRKKFGNYNMEIVKEFSLENSLKKIIKIYGELY